MKHYLIITIFCFLQYFSLAAQEQLTNPNFTTDLSGWTATGAVTSEPTIVCPDGVAVFNGAGQPAGGTLSQNFTPTNGTMQEVTFVFTGHNATQQLNLEIIDNTTATPILTQILTASSLACGNGTFNSSFVASSNNLTIRFTDISTTTTNVDFYLQTASIVQSGSIPTLSEWGLIVLALMLMTFGTLYLVHPSKKVFFNKKK
ncbi:MAG: IPTL-CTERM sorting domain-containing protein [Chitinophagales bacterium]